MAMKSIVSRSALGRLLPVNRRLASTSGLRFFSEDIYKRWDRERKEREKAEEERKSSERTVRTWSILDTMDHGHSITRGSSNSFSRSWGGYGSSNNSSKPGGGQGSASVYGSLDGDNDSSSSSSNGYGSSSTSYGSSSSDYGSSSSSSGNFGIGTSGNFDGSYGSD